MDVRFYSLSSMPTANSNAAGSFVYVTTGTDAGMYYCDGAKMIKLDNVAQDTAGEVKSATVDASTGVATFYNSSNTSLFTLALADYAAAEVSKLSGDATIATASNGVVTIKATVAETSGKIANGSGSDITLAKVATTGMATDITLDPHSKFSDGSDSDQATVQDALDAVATAFDGLVKDMEGEVSALKGATTDASTAETINGAKNYAKAYTDTAISNLDLSDTYEAKGTASSLIDALAGAQSATSNNVYVSVTTAKGEVASVVVSAPDFASLYDENGAAASALVSAKAYSDSLASNYATAAQGSKADTALQSVENASSAQYVLVGSKADNKQTLSVTLGSFATDSSAMVSGLATVEDVTDVIEANEEVTASALADLNSRVSTLEAVKISTGSANGTIAVSGVDVAVSGLKSAAYTEASAYDVAGAAASVQGNTTSTVADVVASVAALKEGAYVDVLDGKIENATSTTESELVTAAQVKEFAAGVTGAMHFRDAVTGDTAAAALATISDPAKGDVALYGTAEYVYNGTEWKLFGDEGAYDVNGAAASALVSAKAYTDASISALAGSAASTSNSVYVSVVTAKGEVTSVAVSAPDFSSLYDEKGAADSALVSAKAYTDTVAASTLASASARTDLVAASTLASASAYTDSKISALAGVQSSTSNSVYVSVVTAKGEVTSVAVSAPDFGSLYDEKGAADSALVSAKAYTDTVAASTLASASARTDLVAASTLASASAYTDTVAASTLASAKAYADGLASNYATAAQGSKADSAIQSVKVNGVALTADASKAVDVLVSTGATNGTIAVAGVDVAVSGLGSAAYTESSAYDVAGAAASVLGTSTDTSASNTVYGAKAYTDARLTWLTDWPTTTA